MGNEASNKNCSESESNEYTGSGYLVSLPTPSLIDPDCESTASTVSIDMHPPSPLTPKDYEHAFNISSIQMSDCWSCYHPQKFGLNPYAEIQNTIHRISKKSKSSNKNQIDWISVFGTQIIQNGHYKAWNSKYIQDMKRSNIWHKIICHNDQLLTLLLVLSMWKQSKMERSQNIIDMMADFGRIIISGMDIMDLMERSFTKNAGEKYMAKSIELAILSPLNWIDNAMN